MRGIITLCGSHRFKDDFEFAAQELALSEWVVLRPAFAKDAHEYAQPVEMGRRGQKRILDDLHLEKIAISQAIVVINADGYIGISTRKEIAHARTLGKRVYWYNLAGATILRHVENPTGVDLRPEDPHGLDQEWKDLLNENCSVPLSRSRS